MSRRRPFVFVFLVTLILILGYTAGCATGGQPHMQAALDELRAARGELETAVSDKGGHRARAIELCDEAIGEVKAGIEYAAH